VVNRSSSPREQPARRVHLPVAVARWAAGSPLYTVGIVAAGPQPSGELLELMEEEALAYRVMQGDDLQVRFANAGDVHLVLLDLTNASPLPEALPEQRLEHPLPIMVALSPDGLAVPGLWLNADDFIVCPWAPGELTIRIRRLVERRSQIPPDAPGVVRAGDLVIDTNRYDVFVAGRAVLLTFKEYELLKLLASYPGRVFSREALLEQVWGYEYFGGTRTVDVHIRRLRSKIEDATHTFIDTVWNVGYRFRA